MKVTFDFSTQQISIEGDGTHLIEVLEAARRLAPALTQISINTGRRSVAQDAPKLPQGAVGTTQNGQAFSGLTLRQFIKTLPLDNASERIAAVAYYVKNHENRDTFSPREMGDWFTFAKLQKPAQMPVAVFDAKKKYGYVESAGHAKWRLTTNGENLIVGKLNQSEESGVESAAGH